MSARPPRLPPLKSIEAFMAVAKTQSFTQAAAALYVTVPAISRRIQALETELGVKLFRRMHHNVSLTDAGAAYAAKLAPAIRQIREAGETIRSTPQREQTLKINLLQSFAAQWLLPRLPRFYAEWPAIDVVLETTADIVNFDLHDVDVAIRLCRTEERAGLHYERLIEPDIFPVCSPELLPDGVPFRDPDDLLRQNFLTCSRLTDMWPQWLRSMRMDPNAAPRRTLIYDDLQLLYEAAAGGMGVAMGIDVMVQRFIQEGRLVAAYGHQLRFARGFHVVCRTSDLDRPVVRAFRRWLLAEARGDATRAPAPAVRLRVAGR
jgi:LysR family glycine cleavage system transcriptional activator